MTRRSKDAFSEKARGAAKPGRNGYDAENLNRFVRAIEGHLDEIATLHEGIASDVATERAGIKDVYGNAKDAGIPIKALKAAIKVRKIERAMEQEVADDYDQIRHALGDLVGTPLGEHALKAPSEESIYSGAG